MGNSDPEQSGGTPRGADTSLFGLPILLGVLGVGAFVAAAKGAALPASAAAAALAILVLARAWGRISLSGLDVTLACRQRRVFPGEELTLTAEIVNRKILPVWTRIELAHPEALAPEAPEDVYGETDLSPFERVEGVWRFRAERRGVYGLGPVTLSAGDTLGLYSRSRTVPYEREIVVFPRPADITDPGLSFRDNFGIHPSKGIIEDPAWYEGTREYTGTRPAKNIHWKASARLSVPQEKIFAPTSHEKAFLFLDGASFLDARDEEGFETSLEILAALAGRLSEEGASFALATDLLVKGSSAFLPSGRGPEQLGTALELLARCAFAPGKRPDSLLSRSDIAGAGFLVVSHSPTLEKAGAFLALPSARRGRIVFLFLKRSDPETPAVHPALFFEDLSRNDTR